MVFACTDPSALHEIHEQSCVSSDERKPQSRLATIDAHLAFAFHVSAWLITFYLERCIDCDGGMADFPCSKSATLKNE